VSIIRVKQILSNQIGHADRLRVREQHPCQLVGYEPPVEANEGRLQCDRKPDVLKLALNVQARGAGRALQPPAGLSVWHMIGLQRSVRAGAIRQGWGGRPVRQEQAQGILVAALGMLAGRYGYETAA
jgi:hypothetical protein